MISMPSKHIDKLEELTPKLSKFCSHTNGDMIQYEIERGTSFGFKLLSEKSISAARVFTSKGSRYPKHNHKQREYMLVYKGKIIVHLGDSGEEKILNVGDCIYIPPDTPHYVDFPEDSWVLAVTIPKGDGFPE